MHKKYASLGVVTQRQPQSDWRHLHGAAMTGLTGFSGYRKLDCSSVPIPPSGDFPNVDKQIIDISDVVHPNSSFTRVH